MYTYIHTYIHTAMLWGLAKKLGQIGHLARGLQGLHVTYKPDTSWLQVACKWVTSYLRQIHNLPHIAYLLRGLRPLDK